MAGNKKVPNKYYFNDAAFKLAKPFGGSYEHHQLNVRPMRVRVCDHVSDCHSLATIRI